MKVHLLYRDRDFDLSSATAPGHPHDAAIVQDLELETLFAAMAQGDKWLSGIAEKVVLTTSTRRRHGPLPARNPEGLPCQ